MEKKNRNQGGDPPAEDSSPADRKNESSVTPTYPKLGDKIKKYKISLKKRNIDLSSRVIDLTNNDYNIISNRME